MIITQKKPLEEVLALVGEAKTVAVIGCGLCARHCKFQPSRIAMKRDKVRKQWKAVKCDLCRDNPEGPQCIKWCPVRCIGLSRDSLFAEDGARPAELDAE